MSRFRLDDDFLSPVRFDTSTVNESCDSLEGSLSDHPNVVEISLTEAVENKITMAESMIESPHDNELKSKESKFVNTCTPVLNENSSDKSGSINTNMSILNENSCDKSSIKRHSSKLKLENVNDHKLAARKRETAESYQKKQESLNRKNVLDSETLKSELSDKQHQKKPTSTSENKNANCDSLKDIKKKQKNSKSSKGDYVSKVQKSSIKLSGEKKLSSGSSSFLKNNSDTKLKDSSVMSTESKESTSSANLKSIKSNSATRKIENINIGSHLTSYEASVTQMIRSSISSESAKIRQLVYMQQMSFYREMNKIKDEMEKQHLVFTERLFKVIEELMQMNASLRLALSNKD